MFRVEVIEHEMLQKLPNFTERMDWILKNKPELAKLVSHWDVEGKRKKTSHEYFEKTRSTKILNRMLDEKEFLSEFGIRSMSKVYEKNPFQLEINGINHVVHYTPAESDSRMFGGKQQLRTGPISFPINFLIVESLERFFIFITTRSLKVRVSYGKREFPESKLCGRSFESKIVQYFLLPRRRRKSCF